ncbi:MAG TPA: Asp-tRNA(Asn)/Glu-tRNA(Gln) amidotransferase subunit GatC [Candidatus Saccharimonadales bacterium]|nr:Asp-tRNA(Asn)/Glu-tRNA(Gln) amidotransferase subunit GatC [Candidatus Saccharimonadales bacterium]
MAKLTKDDVLKLASLARLSLTDDEVAEFQKELEAVLAYVEKLQQVDTTGLQPTAQVTGLTNVMRDDTVVDYGISNEELLALAPSQQDGQLKVKRMIG